jgi:hypothetical protein
VKSAPVTFKKLGRNRRELEFSTGLLGRLVWRMALTAAWLILATVLITLAWAAYLSPLKTFITLAVAVLFLLAIGLFARTGRRSEPRCLNCGGPRLDVLSFGFWDSFQNESGPGGGRFEYAVCKDCGTRRAEYDPDRPYIPTEEEWQSHFAPSERRKREAEKWPFHSED